MASGSAAGADGLEEAEKRLKEAIMFTWSKPEFLAATPRATTVQLVGKTIIAANAANEGTLKKFSQNLMRLLSKCFQTISKCRSTSSKRGRLWTEFHKLSIKELPHLWSNLQATLHIESKEPLFYQSVNLLIFEELLKNYFRAGDTVQRESREEIQFSKDELNAMRYACGYVALKVLKKYEKKKDHPECEMCLGNMAVTGETNDFTSYTSEWFEKINRGGLFPINDETLTFFIAVEKVTRTYLPKYCSNNYENTKDMLVNIISEDADVQFYWTLLSQDIDNEDEAIKLLEEIVIMWVTVRGFSLASTWLEQYKNAKQITVSKNRALRKKLKKDSEKDDTQAEGVQLL